MLLIGGLAAQPTPFRISSTSTCLWLCASTSAARCFSASARLHHGFCPEIRQLHSVSGSVGVPKSEEKHTSFRKRKCEDGLECRNEHSRWNKQVHQGIWEYRYFSGNKEQWVNSSQQFIADKRSTVNRNNPQQVDTDLKLFSAEAKCVENYKIGVSSAMISPIFSRDTILSSPDTLKCNGKSVSPAFTLPLIEKQKEKCSSENNSRDDKSVSTSTNGTRVGKCGFHSKIYDRLFQIYENVLVVDNITTARQVVEMLTNKYNHLVHACDTEVAKIDVKRESPVDHGEIICFSIYSGPDVDFGNGKTSIWVDVLDGGRNILLEFAPFFEHPSIKKVWHNYSFDNHVLENYGFKVSGFHADTMHMARLWNSSRQSEGGYSLEALTSDPNIMAGSYKYSKEQICIQKDLMGKVSMKSIFGRKKIKKDGFEGKNIVIPPVEELQRNEREPWIGYSVFDSISTLNLYVCLKNFLLEEKWYIDGKYHGHMFGFYELYWKPFGELLVKMETEGMLVDRSYLAEIGKLAYSEQETAANRFRNWASKYCPDAKYMNVGSDVQLRQLFFGGHANSKDSSLMLPYEKTFKVPNIDKIIEEGKTSSGKYHKITLHGIVDYLQSDFFTACGWPSVSGDALKTLAGEISTEDMQSYDSAVNQHEVVNDSIISETQLSIHNCNQSTISYGKAYTAFGEGQEGRDACLAIASLCEICTIDSLISNFILPLQGHDISGKDERIHCSLNINTETGRLSARRPNLQNQPALEKDRYKIRKAFIAAPGNSLIVADYGQLELRILAHLAGCKSMLDAFKAGGDFHSRTAMNMYPHIQEAVDNKKVLLEWHPQPGEETPPVRLLKDAFASERRKAKMLNFSIAYGKTPMGLARDWEVSLEEARETVMLWYKERQEVLQWQKRRKKEAIESHRVHTLLGRSRRFPSTANVPNSIKYHIERAAINTPVQGSAADVAMCAMLEISKNEDLKKLGWRLLLQIHDEMILEGPTGSCDIAKDIVVECMSRPFAGKNILQVDLTVDAKFAQNWYSAK